MGLIQRRVATTPHGGHENRFTTTGGSEQQQYQQQQQQYDGTYSGNSSTGSILSVEYGDGQQSPPLSNNNSHPPILNNNNNNIPTPNRIILHRSSTTKSSSSIHNSDNKRKEQLGRTNFFSSKSLSFSFGTSNILSSSTSSSTSRPPSMLYNYDAYHHKQRSSSSSSNAYPTTTTSVGWFLLKIIYTIVFLSWMIAHYTTGGQSYYDQVTNELENTVQTTTDQIQHLLTNVDEIYHYVTKENQRTKELQIIQQQLNHEVRIISEMNDSNVIMGRKPPKGISGTIVANWLQKRKNTLMKKVETLKMYLQNLSRQFVMDRYGIGPHRVKFTFDQIDENGTKKGRNSFVVQLASIIEMPISVHYFLDMVSNQIWDDTILLHHEQVEHVIAVAPINYSTQRVKHEELATLGWRNGGMGYPEYSTQYEHKKYTIGFAGQGPTFYINTLDNTIDHGPSGQTKHLLPNESDPCFGFIIHGYEAVDTLIEYGYHQTKTKRDGGHPWADEQHTWTHLVKVELI